VWSNDEMEISKATFGENSGLVILLPPQTTDDNLGLNLMLHIDV
jgi:hypothetical protein